jgi:hypothetical protein
MRGTQASSSEGWGLLAFFLLIIVPADLIIAASGLAGMAWWILVAVEIAFTVLLAVYLLLGRGRERRSS